MPQHQYDEILLKFYVIIVNFDEKIIKFDIQGVLQYCSHFCFVNLSASKAPRNTILDIFNCPFHVDFNLLLFYEILTEILPKY